MTTHRVPPRRPNPLAAALLGALVAVGCTATPGVSDGANNPDPSIDRSGPSQPPGDRVPSDSPAPIVGEVPEAVLLLIRDDLQQRLGVDVTNATVVEGQAVTFSDGSLDCPEPGMVYTQALVDGYRVVLELDGQTYDYRVPARGAPKLCEALVPGRRP